MVVSPKPATIVEKREIKQLIDQNFIVICCGGGGIPVIREGRAFSGVDAVIDKDLASARLAEEVGVDIFLIATDVSGVALNYGKPEEQFLSSVTLKEAGQYLREGHFPTGSMGPENRSRHAICAAQRQTRCDYLHRRNRISRGGQSRHGNLLEGPVFSTGLMESTFYGKALYIRIPDDIKRK